MSERPRLKSVLRWVAIVLLMLYAVALPLAWYVWGEWK